LLYYIKHKDKYNNNDNRNVWVVLTRLSVA
jgi:hypothetical protein